MTLSYTESWLSPPLLADLADADSWRRDHPVALRDGFNAIARLITDLRDTEAPGGGSYLDKTAILAFSEFGRTARRNARGGRDHLLTNCALLAGAGISAGQVVGASSDLGMAPEHIVLETGTADAEGVSLKPEHVLATFMAAGSLDASALQSETLPTLLL